MNAPDSPPLEIGPDEAGFGALFGTSVAADGDLLVVGAPGSGGGAVYVFALRPDGGWGLLHRLEGPPSMTGFGAAVAVRGGRVATSAGMPVGAGGRVFIHSVAGTCTGPSPEPAACTPPPAPPTPPDAGPDAGSQDAGTANEDASVEILDATASSDAGVAPVDGGGGCRAVPGFGSAPFGLIATLLGWVAWRRRPRERPAADHG
ncbi:MAG: hypothetical protein AB8I08_12625 [Sandaracinaceae bacterium]